MSYISYFKNRVEGGELTVSDCVDLIMGSTITHVPDGHGGVTALPHPPHAHAHMAKDGFQRAMTGEQNRRLAELRRAGGTGGHKLNKARPEYENLRDIASGVRNRESRHIDPATRREFDPEHQIVDPNTRYIDRAVHSQFEDGEAAAMALFYALMSEAGKEALIWLEGTDDRRSVIHSNSAANGLNGPAIPLKNPPALLSNHPLRGQAHQVVERGPGASNAAAVPKHNIGGVTTIIDSKTGGKILLTTHFPVQVLNGVTANKDKVEFKRPMPKAPPQVGTYLGNDHTTEYDEAAPVPALEWDTAATAVSFYQSRYTGLTCTKCGVKHTGNPGFQWGAYWYRCGTCQKDYCGGCATGLTVKTRGNIWHEYKCGEVGCNGVVAKH